MSDKRGGNRINGWIVLDKPAGITSAQAVARVKGLLRARKVGHGGTLDPMASGLLPIALGEATKTTAYLVEGAKTYRFTLRWGQATDTDDAEGEVLEQSGHRPSRAAIEAALASFQGTIQQVPPAYSAVKVDGRRAYEIARAGAAPQLEPRPVRIDALELVDVPDDDHATFVCTCGKGFYIRALARDLGAALGVPAHLAALRRTRVGALTETQMISLETLEAMGHIPAASEHVRPVETALADIPALALTDTEANRLRSGQRVSLLKRSNLERLRDLENGEVVCAKAGGRAVALARFEGGDIHPVRVLNL